MSSVTAHARYASYVARHKYFVFVAGRRTGAPLWRLLVHDWSKFSPVEWGPYVEKFYGNWGTADSPGQADEILVAVNRRFDAAWLHHQHRNPHHWQHWILRQDDGKVLALRIPDDLVREMVADWMGAGRAITGKWEVANWYEKNRELIKLEKGTRNFVESLILEVSS